MPDKHYVTIKAAVIKEGKLLLQKEVKSSGKTIWDLPGGRIDEGENIREGLERELFEEIGVKASSISDLPIKVWSAKSSDGVVALLYRVELESEDFVYNNGVEDEVFDAKFISKDEFLENSPLDHVHKPFILEFFNELAE